MTSFDPPPARPSSVPVRPPQQANPSWMGQIRPQHYRPAPGDGQLQSRPALAPPYSAVPAPRTSAGVVALVLGGGVLAFVSLFLVLPYLLGNTGPGGFVIGFVASLLPLTSVLLAVRFIDRWEPEPRRLLFFAFGWGALVSIAVVMLIEPFFSAAAGPASGLDYTTFAVTVQAPVVEEFSKSLGLVLLLVFARKHFDGPVDGVVFAFTVAGGFAFTENILYFGRAIAESSNPGTDLFVVFFLRGVMSPFAHAIFTGTTGLILGMAARRWNKALTLPAFALGLVPAMLLHSGWNSMGQDFLAQYILVQVPIFLLAVLVVVLLRVAERRLTRQRLQEYAAAGWFSSQEVAMLATPAGRRAALRWARSIGRARPMKALQQAATRLALIRQRVLSGRDVPAHQQDEQRQLGEVLSLRDAVLR
ncbi:PrsW family intramembrane metalloprotease [Arthrobacter sp. B3I4]|uniref:PrsW family intramembrane metalloprotease n=1 Tax=Arthrobacter sp. B3I4 TaxID=3042267 RepID=UPI00277E59B7|nr:PrsW family intramembrane metalloprotease [Arthrobacter sp. B3I4]MDQ0756329.1 RsiW-degrading membrane proteinase PrsW (M82 family) [Arthrobacter sp. B3I4]